MMAATEREQREAVLAEARSWLRCPYHHHAGLKGVGVDCAFLVLRVYEACGLVRGVDPGYYPADWFLHRGEERYLSQALAHAREVKAPNPGDLALYRIGRLFAHGAIVVDWPLIIHAHIEARMVTYAEGDRGWLHGRERRFFTLWHEGRA